MPRYGRRGSASDASGAGWKLRAVPHRAEPSSADTTPATFEVELVPAPERKKKPRSKPLKINTLRLASRSPDESLGVSTGPAAGPANPKPTAVQVEAAKLKRMTDKKLGIVTADWVVRVSQGLPPR
jgi:hypothetical protein